jgi:hypothetical protein
MVWEVRKVESYDLDGRARGILPDDQRKTFQPFIKLKIPSAIM